MIRVLLVLAVLLLNGCGWLGWFGKSEKQRYLETGSSEPTRVPETLDQPGFVDAMPIPEVVDYRGLAGKEVELRLPDALSTTFGVDQIVIRRLGDDRWVFLDLPVATIWPRMVLFWEEHRLPVALLDPRRGVLETEWIPGAGGSPDEIYESMTSGSAREGQGTAQQYRFRVHVEPGVRSGSTELYVEQAERPFGGPDPGEGPQWDGRSDNPELEGRLLGALAYYLGDRVAEGPSVSLLAAGLQESKATLVAGPDGMVLKYRLDFNRAWATVGNALEDARVTIEDLDRTRAVYYVYYTSRHDPDPGFFSRLFGAGGDGREDQNPGHQFRVQLRTEREEVRVTVDVASETASTTDSLILKERLLKLIKEYST